MSEIAWKAGACPPSRLRGAFVKWTPVGVSVEGVVTFLNFEEGCTDPNGNVRGLLQLYDPTFLDESAMTSTPGTYTYPLQLYDPTFLDESPDDHGHYRRIDLGQKALVSAISSCVRAGLSIGGHIKLTFTENVDNAQKGLHPWKRFDAVWADPTLSPEQIAAVVAGGQRVEGENGTPPPAAAPAPAGEAEAYPEPSREWIQLDGKRPDDIPRSWVP